VGDMTQMLIRKLHPAATIVEDDQRLRPPESEVMRLCGDPGKLLRATGWTPQTKLEKGLDETIAWFVEGNHLDAYKPATYHI
jgi:nucleoside-diphosphate-sugar epimerase